jgi:hypothetical protein
MDVHCGVDCIIHVAEILWKDSAKSYASESKAKGEAALSSGDYAIYNEKRPIKHETTSDVLQAWQEANKQWIDEQAIMDPELAAKVIICLLMRNKTKDGLFGKKKYVTSKPPRDNISPGREALAWHYVYMDHQYISIAPKKNQ